MRTVLTVSLLLLIPLLLTMKWSGAAAEKPADFVFVNQGDIITLDPKNMSWLQDVRIAYALWEGLYQMDPVTLEAVPGVADRIDISPDKKTWTFHIRSDAKWSNGDPVVAGDFAFAWKRMLDDPGDYTYLLRVIQGASDYTDTIAAHRPADFGRVGIKVVDARTLRVLLKQPVVYFPDLCAFPPFFPLHEPSMRPYAGKPDPATGVVRYDPRFTLARPLVTNGPFVLKKWEFKKRLRMEKNPYYWDRANVKSDIIEQVSATDALPAFLMYDTGAVDWVASVSGEIASGLRQEAQEGKRNDLRVWPSFGTYFYTFNCNKTFVDGSHNPLSDVRVRRALDMALDKGIITRNITRMGERPADTYIPRGVFKDYKSPAGAPYDVSAARQLLAEAGYPRGRGFPELSILFNNEANHADIAQSVVNQWRNNLGISVRLEGVERLTFRQMVHKKEFSIARSSWFGDYNDPSTFTAKFQSVSENNDGDWFNPAYDKACDAAANEIDPARRLADFQAAEKILLDDSAILPVYYYVNACLFRDRV
jgi:oligopeptide transport system substrate-binding protein